VIPDLGFSSPFDTPADGSRDENPSLANSHHISVSNERNLAGILHDQLQLPESFGPNAFTCVQVCVLAHRLLSDWISID
jgi:hypothetical protein